MLVKTRGIVINYIKYKESSIITKIYTEELGMISCLINGIRSAKSKKSIGYFQPLSLLETIVYHNQSKNIHRLSEWKLSPATHDIQHDIRKTTMVIFLSEILGKALSNDTESHPDLFHFMYEHIKMLDLMQQGMENFHLYLLLRIMPYLGFGISTGEQLLASIESKNTDSDRAKELINQILNQPVDHKHLFSGKDRIKALSLILDFYQHHSIHLSEIKSLKVLHQVFA